MRVYVLCAIAFLAGLALLPVHGDLAKGCGMGLIGVAAIGLFARFLSMSDE